MNILRNILRNLILILILNRKKDFAKRPTILHPCTLKS